MPQWDLRAPKVGEQATDLDLLDESGRPVQLSAVARPSPLIVLAFAGLDDAAGIELLREYRDATLSIRRAGAFICAIGHAEPAALRYLRAQRRFGFPMFSDPDGTALSRWGNWYLTTVSRRNGGAWWLNYVSGFYPLFGWALR